MDSFLVHCVSCNYRDLKERGWMGEGEGGMEEPEGG
jgi:hypothetical protein